MPDYRRRLRRALWPAVAALVATLLLAPLGSPLAAGQGVAPSQPSLPSTKRLPVVYRGYPWRPPFGVELNQAAAGPLLDRLDALGTRWVRLHRISWRAVQPNEGDPYNWGVLAGLEDELRALRHDGHSTPILIVHHSPRWATVNRPSQTDCGAIRAEKLAAFAAFMQALVARYKAPEFNVHFWELGNEPDVDPAYVLPDSPYGCWGDQNDPFYGGGAYGEMLKVVYPAVKAADGSARVLVGGLLLARPYTDPGLGQGRPELFLQGILESGAGPCFDILAYHAYPAYTGLPIDYDNQAPGPWRAMGGWTLGKARFLRQVMAAYGVQKPLLADETALACDANWYRCSPPQPDFYDAQASYIVRTFVRALGEDIGGLLWYTLDGPGWRTSALLDGDQEPRPAYWAYRQLTLRLQGGHLQQAADYGPGVEAYRFDAGDKLVDVAWSTDATTHTLTVPQALFLAAYDRDGGVIAPAPAGPDFRLVAGFSPIYIERLPAARIAAPAGRQP